jgi:cytochrome P450
MSLASSAAIEYEPWDPACRDFDLYAALRDQAPVYRAESGYWVVSRYADVREIFFSPDRFSSKANQDEGMGLSTKVDENMDPEMIQTLLAAAAGMAIDITELFSARAIVAADPPHHTRLRQIVNRGFTPRRINGLKGQVEAMIDSCLAGIDGAESYDLVSQLAVPLPVRVVADLLTVEPENYHLVKRWSDQLTQTAGAGLRGTSEALSILMEMFTDFSHYFVPRIEDRRVNPVDDLLSDLVRAEESVNMSTAETLLFVLSIMAAGNETTTSAISSAVIGLLSDPDQLELVQQDPEQMIPKAVEEAVRWRAPLQILFREALADVEVAGTAIPKGETVVLLVASANHDDRVYDDPGRFDITRDNSATLAFGQGIHYCLGSHLGRLETRLALTKLLPHLGSFRLSDEPLTQTPSIMVWNYERVLLERI